ncbi:hypothetical protein ACFWIA_27450 [Streptomyces sp. NPDC127068]|uniref:hypothetical protein n=1 Tax=Streptomyces sp. NPDC127068 TaxID=3347127 RepID=UPI0036659D77
MILLIGGPPRVGKSTLAAMLGERDGLPHCPADALVSMLQHAAPALGVRHGEHDRKAAAARPFLVEFVRAIGDGVDHDDPWDGYVVEGDVVTPGALAEIRAAGLPVSAVFLGNTALPAAELRRDPQWLTGADPATYEAVAARVRDRSRALGEACERSGDPFVDLGTVGFGAGLERAYGLLRPPG